MSLDDYVSIAEGLIDFYQPRNDLFKAIDDMVYKRWEFPAGMPEWVLKVVSTDPYDSVVTTARTFATIKPQFKVMPMLPNEANRERANQIETALAYNFKQAGRRNDATIEWDVMWSSALYAEVAAQCIYLPYQEKILDAMGKDTKRVKAAKRFGDYAFIIHNPANVYPEWSEYGLEGVLTVRVQAVDEFMDSWGKLANKVVSEKDYNDGRISFVTSFDYINYEKRCVWGIYSDTETIRSAGNGILVLEEKNELGFIPYAIKRWGNSLSSSTNEKVMPLLQSVYDSRQWDMLNVMKSLDASLTMKRAAAVRFAGEFPPGQSPNIDNTEPEGIMELPPGTRNFTPLPNQSIDTRLAMEKNQFESGIWQTTVARVLNTLEFPSGTAYSSVNQLLTTATNSLAPYKMLGENVLAELAHQMLCWIKYYGDKYGKVYLYGQYTDKSKAGMEVSIDSEDIEPDLLQIEVILSPDAPVDKLQQINGAVLTKQNFRVPESELLEELGYGDPRELAERRDQEDYNNAYIAADIQRIQMAPQLEAQAQQMQMQQQAQMQMQDQAMQQEQMAREQEQMQAQAQANASPGNENLGGMGMNPAMGGIPPVQGNRGQK